MVYILELGRVCGTLNIDIRRSRGEDYSGKKNLGSSATNISNWVYNIVLNASYIG
jgi:hypothetical protein